MVDESRQFNPTLQGNEVPIIDAGRPGIEDSTISKNPPARANQLFEDRVGVLACNYSDWSIAMRRLSSGAFVMSYTRRVDLVSMTPLLQLASGNTVLKLRQRPLNVYEGGFYESIGDAAPEYVSTHCALFAQTLEELLLEIWRTGDISRRGEDI